MRSIDLLESPLMILQDEAKRRKKILIGLFSVWLMIMVGLFIGATVLKTHQEKRLFEFQSKMDLIGPQLAELQAQKHRHCVASRLKALFSSPIKGIYLSSVSVNENWLVTGGAEYSQALDQYKSLIEMNMDDAKWEENDLTGRLDFKISGQVSC